MSLYSELKRRNVLKVALAYLVTAYVVVEASNLLLDIFNAPDWVTQTIVVMLAVGFPVAIAFSWMYEWTPDGIQPDHEVDEDARGTGIAQHLVLVTIAMAMIAVGLFLVDRLLLEAPVPVERDGPPVIAVLPFEIIGGDEGTVLADGLHHDLLTRMSKLRAFAVISRTSMLEYANTTKNMRLVGTELGAGYIVEGGVQTVGGNVRINAQLIDATRDEHLWAETYDRELTAANLFAIQSELAIAIAGQLELALTEDDRRFAVEVPTTNTDAYAAYMRAVSLWDNPRGDPRSAHDAIEEAIRLDPNFVLAWLQYIRHSGAGLAMRREIAWPDYLAEMEQALATIRTLAPGSYEAGLANVYFLYYVRSDYNAVLPAVAELESRGPLDADALYMQGKAFRRAGRLEEAYRAEVAALRLSPRSSRILNDVLMTSVFMGDCERAAVHAAGALALSPDDRGTAVTVANYELQCTGDTARATALVDEYKFDDDMAFWTAFETAFIARDWDRAVEIAERGELADSWWGDTVETQIFLAIALRRAGRITDADEVLDEVGEILDAHRDEAAGSPRNPSVINLWLRYSTQRRDEAAIRHWAAELERHARASGPFDPLSAGSVYRNLAFAFAIAGMPDEAVNALDKMFAGASSITFLHVDIHPAFDSIRDHPGYVALRERYGHAD